MGIFIQTLQQLTTGRNRVALSRYPSNTTPELKQAWETPQFRYSYTFQPFADPLTIPGGNSLLNGETYEMRREYREWSFREPPVKAALLTKCFAVASLDPMMTPDDEDDKRDNEAAQWALWSLTRAFGGIAGLVQSMLLPALIDGFSVNEPVWDEVESGGKYRGYWTPKRYHQIDTEKIRFKLDPYRQVIGVRPMTGLAGWQELPPEDFIIFTHLKLFENPFGISDLRAVVRDCRLLEAAIKLRQILLVNFSGPFLWATADSDDKRRQIAAVMERARAQGWIVVPDGCTLTVENLATSNPQVFDSVIQSYRENIVSAIQGGYLQLLEGGVRGDGPGNSQVHRGIAELFQWWLALWTCEVINTQLIPSVVIPNFGNSVGMPRLQLGGVDEATISAALDRFKRGQELGLDLSKKQIRKTGYFEVPDPTGDDVLKAPQQGGGNDVFGSLFKPAATQGDAGNSDNTGSKDSGGGNWRPGPNPNDPSETGYVNDNGTFRKDNPATQMAQGGTARGAVVTFRR